MTLITDSVVLVYKLHVAVNGVAYTIPSKKAVGTLYGRSLDKINRLENSLFIPSELNCKLKQNLENRYVLWLGYNAK